MLQIQPLLHNGNRHIGRNGDPDLCLDGVFGRALESLDSKVLFDPFEEQFHLPSLLAQSANREGWQMKLLVRNSKVFPASKSMKVMRLSGSG